MLYLVMMRLHAHINAKIMPQKSSVKSNHSFQKKTKKVKGKNTTTK